MKKFIKLLPAALALVAITSCSNEDFFSSTDEVKYTKTLVVNHEGINSGITRSSMVPDNSNNVVYDAKDVIRVYDESVTVYDKYTFDGSKFGTTGTKVAAADAKFAIFPSEQVKWGDNDENPKVAVTIKGEVDLSSVITGTETDNGKAYVANIPSWGVVKEGATKDKLEVTLYDMTAIIRVKINHLDANAADRYVKISSATKNISGVFSATLDKNIATTKANTTTQLAVDEDFTGAKTIYANLGKGELNDVYVYLPIVAGEYPAGDVKVEIVTKGAPDVLLAAGTIFAANNDAGKRVFVRGGVYNGGTIGVAPEEAVATSLKDLNDKLKTAAASYAGKTINITVDGEIATTEELQEIQIPTTLTAAQVVNIKGKVSNKIGNKPLTITGGAAGQAYTINFVGGIEGTENVVVAAGCVSPLTLIGAVSSTGTDEYHGQIQVKNTAAVTFGNGTAEQSFSTAMPIVVSTAAPIVINAGEGTIADLTASAASTIDVNNGTVTALKSTNATGAAINVNGGTVTTLTAKGTAADVTVAKDATVATLDASASTAKVDVQAGAKVTTVTTNGDIDVAANIETLTVKKAGAAIKLTGGAKTDKLVTITNLVSDATAAPAVSSTDAAAILNVSRTGDTKVLPTFTSTLNGASKDQKTTSINAKGEIYTAAQLAGVTTGKDYKLMTPVTGTIAWTGVNLNGKFDGTGKTINELTGESLFNTISGGEVKNLTITTATVNADDAAVKGGLASQVTGTTTIQGITITAATVGKGTANKATATSYGGLIGKVNGTVTLIDNQLTAATVQGYALLGGYIGEVAGGTVKIQTTKAAGAALKSKITFAQTMGTVAAAQGGKIGNFIGGITGSGVNVTIGATGTNADAAKDANGLATAGASYSCFFDNTAGIKAAAGASALGYDANTKTVNSVAKKFLGMTETITVPSPDSNFTLFWEIGYSTGSVNTLSFYNKVPKNDLGVATPLTIANINKYQN